MIEGSAGAGSSASHASVAVIYGLAGVVAIGGVLFSCGLFGWAIVRWSFNFINAREGASIVDVVREVKDEVRR